MKLGSWNCEGADFRSRRFRSWLSSFSLAGVQETFKTDPRLIVPGFMTFVSPASRRPLAVPSATQPGRARGGLATFVATNVCAFYDVEPVTFDVEQVESLVLLFTRKVSAPCDSSAPHSFIFGNFYVRPRPEDVDFDVLYTELAALQLRFSCPLILAGDFNAHLPSSAGCALPTSRDADFNEFFLRMTSDGYSTLPSSANKFATFVSSRSSSVIDYFFLSGVNSEQFEVSTINTFGHRALSCHLSWPTPVPIPLFPRSSYRRHVARDLPPNFFDVFASSGLTGWMEVARYGVTRAYAFLILLLTSFLSVSRPPTVLREAWHRYLSSSELRTLISLDDEISRLASLPAALLDFRLLRSKRSTYTTLRRELHSLAMSRLFQDTAPAATDPTRLWAMVKRFRSPAASGGVPVDALCTHFVSVFNRVTDSVPFVFYEKSGYTPSGLDRRFTFAELDSAVRALRRDTAPGPNGIGNDVLLSLFELPGGREFFLHLFNACFESRTMPDPWKGSEIFVLYKGKGDVLDPNSYRGIALLDSSFKLYERLLYNRLTGWASFHEKIPPAQFGFRAKSGTLDAGFTFYVLICKYVLGLGRVLFTALIDFRKAFPSVNRAKLISKLRGMGVSAKFLDALCVMFEGNSFTLRADDQVTDSFPVITGLREGGVLSPLLFSLFISDMSVRVLRPFSVADFASSLSRDPELSGYPIPGLLYADDLILVALTENSLRIRLRYLAVYARENDLCVNVQKSEVVVFGSKSRDFCFKFAGEVLPVRSACKYLGIWFDSSGSSRLLQKEITAKFKAAVPTFFSLCRRLHMSRLDHVFKLASSLLFSILYGVEFLEDPSICFQLESLFFRGVRKFFGLPSGVSNLAI